MEVKRERLGSGPDGDFRARQLRARQMLRGELDGPELQESIEERLGLTTMDKAANWARAWTWRASARRRCAPRRGRPT